MTTDLAIVPHRELVLSPVMDLALAKARMQEFQEFVHHYLEPSTDGGQDGGDYGPIPGAGKKKVLLKSGADKLCELYGLYDEYEIEAQEDFTTKLFYYKIKCILKSRRDDSIVGTGVGSCSTYESKYRWRDSQRECPKCHNATIIKGREEYGGGWLCFAKKGGCGAKFKDGEASIESQNIGRTENPDIMDTVNTVLKMAKKRAKIDAVIGVTRSSGIFTQDLEDVAMPQPEKGSAEAQKAVLDRKLREIAEADKYHVERKLAADSLNKVTGFERSPEAISRELNNVLKSSPVKKATGLEPVSDDDATGLRKVLVASLDPAAVRLTPERDAEEQGSAGSAAVGSVQFIDRTQCAEIHIQFRETVRANHPDSPEFNSDAYFYQWLLDHGFYEWDKSTSPPTKIPTSSMIPKSQWFPVKKKMLEYAKKL